MLIQSSHCAEDRGLDAYFTPPAAVWSLLAVEGERIPRRLWEPACGDGAISRVLEAAGYDVLSSDIADYGFGCSGVDYLKAPRRNSVDGIVTNAPFKEAAAFAKKAIGEVPYVALLLRTNFLESVKRLPVFRRSPPSRIWISARRLPMMHRHGWTGKKASSNTAYSWFVWERRFLASLTERTSGGLTPSSRRCCAASVRKST